MRTRLTAFNGHGGTAATNDRSAGQTDEIELRNAFDMLYDQIKYQGVSLQNVRDALAERIMLYTRKSKAASESLGLTDNPLRQKRGEMTGYFQMAGDHTLRQTAAYGETIDVLCKAIVNGRIDWSAVKNTLVAFASDDHATTEEAIAVVYKGGAAPVPPRPEYTGDMEDRTAAALGVLFELMRAPKSTLGFRDVRDSLAVKMIERAGHSKAARTLDMGRSTMYRIQQSHAALLQSPQDMPQKSERYACAIDTLCDALQTQKTTLKDIEQETMEFMLSHARTKTDCAFTLGMGRSTFYRKLQILNIG